MIDFDIFTKIAQECERFVQINCCQRLLKSGPKSNKLPNLVSLYICHAKRTKRQPKETGFGPFLKINDFSRNYLRKFLKNSFVFKVSHSRLLISFSLQITVTTWSATWVLCCWKQLVCQLCLCHCPNCLFVIVIC